MDKAEILDWNRKYDVDHPWWIKIEKELGGKFRQSYEVTKNDLLLIIEWKFLNMPWKDERKRDAENVNENELRTKSQIALRLSPRDDYERISNLRFKGINASTISVILSFFDPHNYGVFDRHVWRGIFGHETSIVDLFNIDNYIKLLSALRTIAEQYDLPVRTVEKAYFKRDFDKAGPQRKNVNQPINQPQPEQKQTSTTATTELSLAMYKEISEFETSMRNFIYENIKHVALDISYNEAIPRNIREKWKQLKQKDISQGRTPEENLLSYADFSDYKEIIFFSWKHFFWKYFKDRERFEVYINDVANVGRNPTMHNRTITVDEVGQTRNCIRWIQSRMKTQT